jgi:integrase
MNSSYQAGSLEAARNLAINRRSGYEFIITDDVWTISSTHKIRMKELSLSFNDGLRNGLIGTMLFYSTNRAPGTAERMNAILKVYSRACASFFDKATITNFRDSEPKNAKGIKAFLLRWRSLGYDGIEASVFSQLERWKFKPDEVLGSLKGIDPSKGALDDRELLDVLTSLQNNFAEGRIGLEPFSMMLLFIHTGMRLGQLSLLRVGDIRFGPSERYFLSVPRTKQRGAVRSEFKTRELPAETGEIVSRQAQASIEFFEKALSKTIGKTITLQLSDRQSLPIFPATRLAEKVRSVSELREKLKKNALCGAKQRFWLFVKTLDLGVIARDGSPIHLNPGRLRHTLATRAMLSGHPIEVVAEILDHSSVAVAKHYFDKTPVIVKVVDALLAEELAIVAQGFLGKLIDTREYADRAADPSSIIRIKNHVVGNCGSFTFCPSVAGEARCYPCKSFQPWLDGPHEAVLATLNEQRRYRLEQLTAMNPTFQEQTVSIGVAAALDPLIFYVKLTILACAKRRGDIAFQKALLNE